ncbi:hypothetical protein FRB99_005533 [Tulasnella sp. 403]|nr:hypothetical protein FRB99_005533 [Tulasnella sp. 403]
MAYLSKDEAERKLTENAFSTTVPRAGKSGVWRWETAFLASNNPIEDANAQMIVQPTEKGGDFWGKKGDTAADLLFFAIMDGHGGFNTSRLLAKTLIPSVALELQTLTQKPTSSASTKSGGQYTSFLGRLWGWMSWASRPEPTPTHEFNADPKYVEMAIKTAFSNLDSQIINTPIKAVDELTKGKKALDASGLDPASVEYQLTVATLLPALSGSCALMALLDSAHNDLYVACTGDSRAIAGYWDVDSNGNGKWRVEVLTEDQTGRNLNEVKRVQSEHPPEESEYVIQRGRVFGGLEPTRAFGDARYKWPKDFQQRLRELFDEDSELAIRRPPGDLKTPPYVIPTPEVTHRKLPISAAQDPNSPSTLRFLVMATDGLWDKLSSAEVASLVGEYLNRVSPAGAPPSSQADAVLKSVLAKTVTETPLAPGIAGVSHSPSPSKDKDYEKESWSFSDKNVATHLIRNALGGADEEGVRQLLSIPAPLSRRYRDDLTVTVVWWEEPAASDGAATPEKVKARL